MLRSRKLNWPRWLMTPQTLAGYWPEAARLRMTWGDGQLAFERFAASFEKHGLGQALGFGIDRRGGQCDDVGDKARQAGRAIESDGRGGRFVAIVECGSLDGDGRSLNR